MSWHQEFPGHEIPHGVLLLVGSGALEDMSWRNDPAPSFGARLRDKNWIRLWVEHQDPSRRSEFPNRFTVMIQPDPAVPFGRRIAATEDMGEALEEIIRTMKTRGKTNGHFRILPA